MLYPSITDLLEKVDSRYTLVLAASKRARQLIDGDKALVKTTSKKPVSIATQEIYEDKITYRRVYDETKTEDGIEIK